MTAIVRSVQARAYTVPTDQPEADGTLSWSATTMVVAEVSDGERTGLGWTYSTPACADVVTGVLAERVAGRAVLDVTGTWVEMVKAVRNVGRPGVAGYAISAVDVALWDLKAQVLGVPLSQLFGRCRDEVPLYGSGGFTTYDDDTTRRQLDGWLSDGFSAVKIKIGEGAGSAVARDLHRVQLVRTTVGDRAEVMVDANGGYTVKQAVRIGRSLDDAGVVWFEEPVSSDDLEGLTVVRSAIAADVAAGEYGHDVTYFRRMCERSVDCLQIDATRCGGYTEWFRAAAVAASYGLQVSGHCAPALHQPAATATPNLRHLEWFHDHARIEQRAFDGWVAPRHGTLPSSDAPGLGLLLKDADLEDHRVR